MAGQLGDMDYTWYGDAVADTPLTWCRQCGGEGRCIHCSGLGYDVDDMGQPCGECEGSKVCPLCEGEGEYYAGEDYEGDV